MSLKPLLFFLAFLLTFRSALLAQDETKAVAPVIDGLFPEWTDRHVVATDPAGDATGAFDVVRVSANLAGSKLFVRLELASEINLQDGAETDGTLVFRLANNHELPLSRGKALNVDFRNRKAWLIADGKRVDRSWSEIGFVCLPAFASRDFEFVLDIVEAGLDDVSGIAIGISGSDSVDFVPIELSAGVSRPDANAWGRRSRNTIRIANLNTRENGLADSKRQEKFRRLGAAARADVYCLQEEWNQSLFDESVARVFPDAVNRHWHSGCAIVTGHELEPLPMALDWAAAALVRKTGRQRVVLVSVNFQCCGYAGSEEDRRRIQQVEQLVGEIRRMREGAFGVQAKGAPVILVGNYNLVGSRRPLDGLNAAGLRDFLMRCPSDGSAFTWRGLGPDKPFWPARLDFISHDSRLKPSRGLIVDSERMPRELRKEHGLEADDSRASDHLMLVADFGFYTVMASKPVIQSVKMDCRIIETACEMYAIRNQKFPESLSDLLKLPKGMTEVEWGGPYLEKGKPDPWGNEYRIRANPENDTIAVWSVGPDGIDGTEDDIR